MVPAGENILLRQLTVEDWRHLEASGQKRSYAAGQEIFKEGDPGDGLYIVLSGQVQISSLLNHGERHVFSTIPPGDIFGEMTLLDDSPRSACATAETDCALQFIPRKPLVSLLQNRPELIVTLVQEISERLREFNRQYVDKMIEAEKMSLVGRFASSIIHDLKSPLTTIAMAARSACRAESTPDSRRVAEERIVNQVDRITCLVNDILDFVQGNNRQIPLCGTSWPDFIRRMTAEVRPDLEHRRCPLILENEPPDLTLQLHPKRLLRVFVNLLDNAVDAMPEGGQITMRFQHRDNRLITEIQDQGPGIPPDKLTTIFAPFATFGKAKGTGLGLAICQRIVEEHHGTITAHNHHHGGAVFRVALPAPAMERSPS